MEIDPRAVEYQQDYDASLADAQARLEHQVQLAQAALKGLMIVNGGAVIALFTFMGSGKGQFDETKLWWAFSLFVIGLVLTLLATTLGFVAQGFYMNFSFTEAYRAQARMMGREPQPEDRKLIKIGDIFEYSGVVAAFCSLASFGAGSACAIGAVLK